MQQPKRQRMYAIATALYCLLLCLPLLGALEQSFPSVEELFSARLLGLLWNSIQLGGAAGVLSCTVGTLAALFLYTSALRTHSCRYFFVLLIPVPYYLYALSWMYLMQALSRWDSRFLAYSIQGFGAALFVETMAFLPLAMLFALLGLERIPSAMLEMACLYRTPNQAALRVVLRAIAPYTMAALGCILVLSAADFSVPSMFQYSTYALSIFSTYSRTGSVPQVFALCVPLLLALFLPFLWLVRGIGQMNIPQRSQTAGHQLILTGWLKGGCIACFVVVCAQLVLPFGVYLFRVETFANFAAAFKMIYTELFTSLRISALASLLCVALVIAPAQWLAAKTNLLWWALLLGSLLVPGAIQSIGLLFFINGSPIGAISQTILLPALGCVLKYAPLALLLCAVAYRRIDKRRIELAQLLAPNPWAALQVKYRMFAPSLLCAATLTFLLSMGEEGIFLVLTPPGLGAASVKIYNYLHYGASEYVAGFCLIIICCMLLLQLLLLLCYRMLSNHKKVRKPGNPLPRTPNHQKEVPDDYHQKSQHLL